MKKAAGIVNIDDYLYESWKETPLDEGEE